MIEPHQRTIPYYTYQKTILTNGVASNPRICERISTGACARVLYLNKCESDESQFSRLFYTFHETYRRNIALWNRVQAHTDLCVTINGLIARSITKTMQNHATTVVKRTAELKPSGCNTATVCVDEVYDYEKRGHCTTHTLLSYAANLVRR